ncbi:regulatory protein RecX [Pseudogemmatithrix spongiicola]|uniref:Regulatory protein RecX n=1 Tax=Pseudogemmatithrix spongiicola TaxID=3062599 RepID=A0AA49JUX8_9BACT|nr:regulatory protein RecX [Gemmatimonadaceae bacterium 'strain 138']WKW15394.1 regulatory protein RecX [Gemmatimonadaceae bacterium 'strain 318']
MATITKLREHPRKPGRFELELDAATTLTISLELIADLKLKVGRVLDEAEQRRLESSAQGIACYDKALATLGARARSEADLRRYLRTKEFTDEQITPAIERLTALGLLDDVAYARTFARARLAPSRGFGPRRVAAELARKGVARDIAERVLGEMALELEEQADDAAARGETLRSAVEVAAAKKLRSLQGLEPAVQQRRLYGFLARRGFSGAEIGTALRMLKHRD